MSNCQHCNKWLDTCYFGNECMECVHKRIVINYFTPVSATPSVSAYYTTPLKISELLPKRQPINNEVNLHAYQDSHPIIRVIEKLVQSGYLTMEQAYEAMGRKW